MKNIRVDNESMVRNVNKSRLEGSVVKIRAKYTGLKVEHEQMVIIKQDINLSNLMR